MFLCETSLIRQSSDLILTGLPILLYFVKSNFYLKTYCIITYNGGSCILHNDTNYKMPIITILIYTDYRLYYTSIGKI